ncbi:hypothetical protein GC101_19260 [Paenibacillus sp. LMG 31459]|uniref:Uncharacterized protein n=1 Tax=Paenibacillus phytohabitans TaxID=2654978 RepID=A0ABX1YMW9_9BACL|nr:hypothetical protein [Paenibacillus phytohabitans]NOU81004.1 hypothetical protein [Paenibacillus phytohabitans]
MGAGPGLGVGGAGLGRSWAGLGRRLARIWRGLGGSWAGLGGVGGTRQELDGTWGRLARMNSFTIVYARE